MTPEDIMPFGKHRGRKMKDVPHDWFMWLYRQGVTGAIRNYIEEYVLPEEEGVLQQRNAIKEAFSNAVIKGEARYWLRKWFEEETDEDQKKIWQLLLEKALLTRTCQSCTMTIHPPDFDYYESSYLLPCCSKCRVDLQEKLSTPGEPIDVYKPYDPMPFGRFMNVPLIEVPSWYLLEIEDSPEIGDKLKAFLKKYREFYRRSPFDL